MLQKRWFKWCLGLAGAGMVALAILAVLISRDAACPAPPLLASGATSMKAITQRCYGDASVLRLERVAKAEIAPDEVLIRVHAAAVNPTDYHYMRGTPYLLRLSNGFSAPTDPRFGVDMAGVIEQVGSQITDYQVGDAVFGGANGAFAEYVAKLPQRGLARKPTNISFEQAAALPIAGVTALQALRDKAELKPGQHVLINGASGGVGSFAVQIAKAMGAHVTAVCSTRNIAMVRALGADAVIDYTQKDFSAPDSTGQLPQYDAIIDLAGSHSLGELARALKPMGTAVLVGRKEMNDWWGPVDRTLLAALKSKMGTQRFVSLLAELNSADLAVLANYAQTGQLRAEIGQIFSLADSADAVRLLESGRASAKVVIRVSP